MSALTVNVPFPVFNDKNGDPLENGYIWIGEPNLSPQTNPVAVYFDEALTVPASQPLRTIGGYVSRSGSPAQLYVDGTSFSLLVQDKKGTQVYSFPAVTGQNLSASTVAYVPSANSLMLALAPLSVNDALDALTGDDTSGAAMVGYLPAGTGAVATDVQSKLRESVSVTDFAGVDPTGVTDSTVGVQAALNSCGALGGTVRVPNGVKLLIDGNLTIPANVSLVGPHQFVGTPQDNAAAPYGNLGGVLMINPAASITLMGGSSISGFYIWRKGMTFPATTTAAFAGTALLGGGDDVGVAHCLVMGFEKAYYSTGKQRPRIHNVYMDCLSGIDIAVCYDIPYITECHAWPFATIASPGAPLIRSGTAFSIRDVGDWAKFTNCFSYGYSIGCTISNANSVTLLGCGFDNVPSGNPSAIGIEVIGNSLDTRITNCQTAAHGNAGIYINTGASQKTTITNHNVWGGMSHGILVYGGDVTVRTTGFRELGHAISVTNVDSVIDLDDSWFQTLSGVVINSTVPKANIRIGANNDFRDVVVDPTVNMSMPAVASAAAVQLPSTGSTFYVTGTTGIGTLTHAWPGRHVTLVFVNAVPIYSSSGTPGSMRLNGGVTFSAPAGGSLTLCGIGGNAWVEVGRAA